MRFAFQLLQRFSSTETVAQHVSMVRSFHHALSGRRIRDGATGNHPSIVSRALKGYADLFPVTKHERFAVTADFFTAWRRRIAWYSRRHVNATVAFETAYQGLLRPCEYTAKSIAGWARQHTRLTRADLSFVPSVEAPRFAVLYIRQAKRPGVDRHNQRNPIILPYDAGAPVNACRALRALALLDPVPASEAPRTPLFRDLSRPGHPPVTYKQLFRIFRRILPRATDIDPMRFGLHSLRIGGATALLAAGCPRTVIQSMGRWSSDVYRLYARSSLPQLMHWQLRLGRTVAQPLETATALQGIGVPLEGTPSWSAQAQADHSLLTSYDEDEWLDD